MSLLLVVVSKTNIVLLLWIWCNPEGKHHVYVVWFSVCGVYNGYGENPTCEMWPKTYYICIIRFLLTVFSNLVPRLLNGSFDAFRPNLHPQNESVLGFHICCRKKRTNQLWSNLHLWQNPIERNILDCLGCSYGGQNGLILGRIVICLIAC